MARGQHEERLGDYFLFRRKLIVELSQALLYRGLIFAVKKQLLRLTTRASAIDPKQPVEINPETRNAVTVMKEIILTKQPVELFKILKFEGMAGTGGEAKMLIADGQVKVNGAKEIRKRKQIVADDVIEFRGEKFVVHLQP
jgi:ribosome-associated protein